MDNKYKKYNKKKKQFFLNFQYVKQYCISQHSKILSKRKTKLTYKNQRLITNIIKNWRIIALLIYY
uniref:ribosomal protein S18 n=1 Tax=Thonningia sanguinea TaxID=1618145 RepID=UPI0026E1A328|nr:ribosomal protein S18 [Thonningia sanguinea]WJE89140.1 ribosomal protein S18 [Thonningia sanguinea]